MNSKNTTIFLERVKSYIPSWLKLILPLFFFYYGLEPKQILQNWLQQNMNFISNVPIGLIFTLIGGLGFAHFIKNWVCDCVKKDNQLYNHKASGELKELVNLINKYQYGSNTEINNIRQKAKSKVDVVPEFIDDPNIRFFIKTTLLDIDPNDKTDTPGFLFMKNQFYKACLEKYKIDLDILARNC